MQLQKLIPVKAWSKQYIMIVNECCATDVRNPIISIYETLYTPEHCQIGIKYQHWFGNGINEWRDEDEHLSNC
jgi:hypothetical protein